MNFHAWLSDSLTRLYPIASPADYRKGGPSSLVLAKGEKGSVQVGFWFDGSEPVTVDIRLRSRGGLKVLARRVESVPLPRFNTETSDDELDGVGRIPGYVPDVLWPETSHFFPARQVHAYWLDIQAPVDGRAGDYAVEVSLLANGRKVKALRLGVRVAGVVLQPRRNFPVTHWFYADALCDQYHVEPWSEGFWPIFDKYVANLVSHGSNTLYVPVFTPPLDGIKRPTQLLGVKRKGTGAKAVYQFDWTHVDTWIDRARRAGIAHFEWSHLFTQWGVKHAIRIYEVKQGRHVPLWPDETPAMSDVYRRFLSQYLPALRSYLDRHKLLDCSYFHLSDEPQEEHLEAYRAARELLREFAPWMKTMDALSHVEFARHGLVDLPIPVVSTALDFTAAGLEPWTYYCCAPRGRHINRLLDTPLNKVRMAGWLFYKLGMRGFLHWGYNYWHRRATTQLIDPFLTNDAEAWPGWAHGDPFVVYPGTDGPIDSIRWEVFAASLQDYALLQTLEVDPASKPFQALGSFSEFPRNEGWIERQRRRLLK